MALDLTEQYNFINNDTFRLKVAVAFSNVAAEVLTETPYNPLRRNFAISVMNTEYSMFFKYAAMVVVSPEITDHEPEYETTADIPDDIILDIVRSLWNPLAGVIEE